jgi:hypothetical protein
MRYILHYTQPGDVVYDGFCGTGMTGVAAQLCGDRAQVQSLGYHIDAQDNLWETEAWAARQALDAKRANPHPHLTDPKPFSKLGARKAVLNDLSPAATFIAYNYNTPVDAAEFEREAKRVLADVEAECGWMYTTLHGCSEAEVGEWAARIAACQTADEAREVVAEIPAGKKGRINYTVWSDVFLCPACGADIVFWDAAVDQPSATVADKFSCQSCSAETTKRRSDRKWTSVFDVSLDRFVRVAVQLPVYIRFKAPLVTRAQAKSPDLFDSMLIGLTERLPIGEDIPTGPVPNGDNTTQPKVSHGVDYFHQFHTRRNLAALAKVMAISPRTIHQLPFAVLVRATSRLVAYNFGRGGNKPRAGTLYLSGIPVEANVVDACATKVADIRGACREFTTVAVTGTSSSSRSALPNSVLDYVFTDPPYGANIKYSELSSIWEAWLGIRTSNVFEAIESSAQAKGVAEYSNLLLPVMKSYFRALKPGRWMTVEFHSAESAVWNAIGEAIQLAGFIVADVRALDPGNPSIAQFAFADAVRKALILSCYKPSDEFQRTMDSDLGHPSGVQAFLDQHLAMLPVAPVTKTLKIERLAERTTSLLYDRMIAYHLVRGAAIPLSATEFSRLLAAHYVDRDGMWFLPGQEAKYDALKMRGVETEQLSLYVQDEKSAIGWLRAELQQQSQTQGELTPKFMQACKEWPKNETRPELIDLLKDSFIPGADGHWQLPDPENEEHLAQLRQTTLLKVFRGYSEQALTAGRTTKLANFRTEAMLEGFKYCWQTDQFAVIVAVAARLKPDHLQAHTELMLLVDLAKQRVDETEPPAQLAFIWE